MTSPPIPPSRSLPSSRSPERGGGTAKGSGQALSDAERANDGAWSVRGPGGHPVGGGLVPPLGSCPHPSPLPLGERAQKSSPLPFREGGQGVRSVSLLHLGLVEYGEAWEIQRRLVAARRAGEIGDTLILLEHPHVYTLGRRADEAHVLADPARLAEIGAALFRIDRGGDVTYHGPGQLVGYPILDLKRRGADVHRYVDDLEETIIRTLADYGLESGRSKVNPGVWVGEQKIAAIGVKVAHWIASHGFALNVDPDLAYFDEIVPCGLHDRGVTSMAQLLGRKVAVEQVAGLLVERFAEVFDVQLVGPSLARLPLDAT